MTRAAFISRDSQFSFLARHAPALLSLSLSCNRRSLASHPNIVLRPFTFPTKEARERASGFGGGRRLHKSWSVVQPAPFGEHGAHLFTLRLHLIWYKGDTVKFLISVSPRFSSNFDIICPS